MSEQYPWLVVGCRVTQIDDSPWHAMDLGETAPEFGAVYTVRDIVPWRGEIGIRLAEIVNPPALQPWGYDECVFIVSCFRPVKTIDTSSQVSALKKIVADVFQNDSVPA